MQSHWKEKKNSHRKYNCVDTKLFSSERKRMLPKVLRNLLAYKSCFVFNGFKRGVFLLTVLKSTTLMYILLFMHSVCFLEFCLYVVLHNFMWNDKTSYKIGYFIAFKKSFKIQLDVYIFFSRQHTNSILCDKGHQSNL